MRSVRVQVIAVDGQTFSELLSQSLKLMNKAIEQQQGVDAKIQAGPRGTATVVVTHR
jgi:hypothetical protein